MHNTTGQSRPSRSVLTTAILLASMPCAYAFELTDGSEDWAVRFDNTLKASYGQRVEGQNSKIAGTSNLNDGDKNFGVGSAVSQRVDLLSELDVVYQGKKALGSAPQAGMTMLTTMSVQTPTLSRDKRVTQAIW